MPIVISNTLSGKKETFTPIEAGKVKMYVCGPTVYNFIHIGNARVYVFFDVVQRYFEHSGYQVTRVINYTDVDDKIIHRANEEKTTCDQINSRYIQAFLNDMKALGIKPSTQTPQVTTHIKEIITLIEGLIKNGAAYAMDDGEVFYSVRSFPEYGKLSGKKIDELLVGARVQKDEKKKDPLDFSLWKPQKGPNEPAWDSPWGKGRPGWHIECSAMAMKYLGQTFDLHGGGRDLIHPHHENEIAQSEAFSKKPFVKYWMHNNMLTFNSEKMSKSIGNILLTKDFIELYSAEALKYFLLSGHYRSTIDYSEENVKKVHAALHRIYSCLKKAHVFAVEGAYQEKIAPQEEKNLRDFHANFKKDWQEAMDDDFNTAKVIGLVFEYVRLMNTYLDKKGFKKTANTDLICLDFVKGMAELSKILNILGEKPAEYLGVLKNIYLKHTGLKSSEIEAMIEKRTKARAAKNFAEADEVRKSLMEKGIELKDSADRTEWDVVFS